MFRVGAAGVPALLVGSRTLQALRGGEGWLGGALGGAGSS